MKLRTRLTTVLATLALALAACGGAEDVAVDDPPGDAEESVEETGEETGDDGTGSDEGGAAVGEDGGDDADEDVAAGTDEAMVLAAARQDARGRSARIAFSITTVTPEGEIVVEGQGESSPDGRSRVLMEITGGTPGGDLGELELRIVDGVIYQRNEQLTAAFGADATWLAIDPETMGGEFSGMISKTSTGDPAEILDVLGDAGEVTATGEQDVNGVATTRYEATVTHRALLEGADADPAEFEGYGVDLDAPSRISVWIDAEGLVRRIAYDTTFGDGASVSSTHDVLAYDVAVDVEVPPEDQTVSFAEMMGGLDTG